MRTNPCRTFALLLAEFLDGDLAPQQAQQVTAHLAACRACAAELDREQRLRTILGGPPPAVCPPQVTLAVREAIARESAAAAPARAARRGPRIFPLGLAASLAAVLVVAVLTGTPRLVPAPPRPAPPAIVSTTSAASAWTPAQLRSARADLQWTLAVTARVIERARMQTVSNLFGSKLPQTITGSLRSAAETAEGGQG